MRAITPEAARANPLDESYCNVSPEAVEVNNRTMRKRRGRSSRNLRTKFRIESLYAEIRTLKRENEALARILAEIRRNQGLDRSGRCFATCALWTTMGGPPLCPVPGGRRPGIVLVLRGQMIVMKKITIR